MSENVNIEVRELRSFGSRIGLGLLGAGGDTMKAAEQHRLQIIEQRILRIEAALARAGVPFDDISMPA